jgi:hypothetical protein
MAYTTLAALVATVSALPVPGIKKAVPYRPRIINPTDLPLLYTRLPHPSNDTSTLTYGQGLHRATLEIVVFSQLLNLDKQDANDALTVQLMDSLTATLESNAAALGMDAYTLKTEEDTIDAGATPVQAILATVEVSG